MMEHLEFFVGIFPALWKGLLITLELSGYSLLLGMGIGLTMALLRTYGNGPLRALAVAYIEVIRGTPMVVQLFLVYFGLPDVGILLDRFTAAVIALGINSGAYQAEYFRGAILSIDSGQMLAAEAIGMRRMEAVRHIILPQAARIVLPAWSNEVVYMVKYTSIAFLIAVPELMGQARGIISWTFRPLEVLFWAGLIYIAVLSLISRAVDALENRLKIPGFQVSREPN